MGAPGFIEREWYHEDSATGWGIRTAPLSLLGFLYGLGVRARLLACRKGLLRKNVLPGVVVSIGNLTVGGTGKTPMVALMVWLA